MFQFQDARVVVTGGSRGIGESIVAAFAQAGAEEDGVVAHALPAHCGGEGGLQRQHASLTQHYCDASVAWGAAGEHGSLAVDAAWQQGRQTACLGPRFAAQPDTLDFWAWRTLLG